MVKTFYFQTKKNNNSYYIILKYFQTWHPNGITGFEKTTENLTEMADG